tara:strand:- start:150 stop:710 length:561 start_codon:yes stop_codon:yes gene_type:complete
MSFIENNKKSERIIFKKIRNESSLFERKIVKENIERFINSLDKNKWIYKYFAIYYPLKDEVDLRDLKKKYPLALPKCESNNILKFYAWDDSKLKKDKEGILAPNNNRILNHNEISYIFVPCLSIDKRLNRLGYGGGYYDKLRSKREWRSIPCIGVLTEKCVSKNYLTKANWDIPLNGYITNNKILI